MKNLLGREGGQRPFEGAFAHQKETRYHVDKHVKTRRVATLEELLDRLDLHDGMTISFHHHLRNGDFVLNRVLRALYARGLKDLHVAASSIFPCHAPLVEWMEDETVTRISTSYVSGPVADAISRGKLRHPAQITTHGGRPRSILEGELVIDIAFVAAPAATPEGAISGSEGPSACGSLGYAIADLQCAKTTVAITDHCVDAVHHPDVEPGLVDYLLEVDQIGDPSGIVSGTTRVTRDPIGLKIARDAARLLEAAGTLQDGFSLQTGAGGISLAVAAEVRKRMREQHIVGSFGCGGITGFFVQMLEEGLFRSLADVQCFDIDAVQSIERNAAHHKISASEYANPNHPGHYASRLDCVILGCSEIDRDYNVNVTTGSDGRLLGGSGGHADTAAGAKLTIITTKLFNARVSAFVDSVRTVTTPGETVDAVVTEYGVAINPRRSDLIERVREQSRLTLLPIEALYERALSFTGKPKRSPRSGKPVAYSIYRDGTILDTIDRVE